MKLERTKNAKRNIMVGLALKIFQIIMPFIMRTALAYYLGIEYLGINSLFSSILSVLTLAELGVGSALVFSMYKPIAEDDTYKICALMKLYRTYYRVIGIVIAIAGIAITPALPYMIRSTLPGDVNLYVLYYINLAATVLSYWLFAYKNSVLAAHQRNDISNKITICVNVTLYLTQFVLLVYLKNYYVYLLLALLSQILINIITAFASDKMFPQYSPKGKLKKEEVTIINRKVRDLFTAKLGGTITNSADSIVISAFLGLTVLAIYNNYFYIVSSIIGFATIGNYALMAGIGNSIVTESKSKNYNDFRNITHVYMFAICICTSCFLNLFQPFMKMWMGEKRMLDMGAVICLCIYFIVYEVNAVLNLYKDAAGIWHQDRFRPLVVSLINLCLNLATVKKIGIYGVILSTVVSIMFVGIPWVTKNLFNNIFEKKKMKKFAIKLVIYLLEIVLISSLSYLLCNMVTQKGIIEMILKLILSVVISLGGFVILNYKTDEFKEAKIILSKVIKG